MGKSIVRKVIEATRKRPDLSKTFHPIGGTDYKRPVGMKRLDPSKITRKAAVIEPHKGLIEKMTPEQKEKFFKHSNHLREDKKTYLR